MKLSISEMADLVGLSMNTLRNWENQNLIKPERTKGNQRIYQTKDYYRILYILYLNKERKIPLDRIPSYLKNPINKDFYIKNSWTDSKLQEINWKEERSKLGISLHELSKSVNISISYLSKIENGASNVSMNVLAKLADFYRINIYDYYSDTQFMEQPHSKSQDRIPLSLDVKGASIEKLGQTPDNRVMVMLYDISPNAQRIDFHHRQGYEIVYVERGKIEFYIKEQKYTLENGDSIQFFSHDDYRWKNLKNRTKLIWTFVELNP